MDKSMVNRPQPIDGERVYEPLLRRLGRSFVAIPAVFGGALLLWGAWIDRSAALGIPALVLITWGIFAWVRLFFDWCLILGADCLQVVSIRGEKVLAQIPYRNIARVELVRENGSDKFIGIDLADLNDPETFCPNADISKKYADWHYRVTTPTRAMPLERILERLQRAQVDPGGGPSVSGVGS